MIQYDGYLKRERERERAREKERKREKWGNGIEAY